jgi:hypothetical protein
MEAAPVAAPTKKLDDEEEDWSPEAERLAALEAEEAAAAAEREKLEVRSHSPCTPMTMAMMAMLARSPPPPPPGAGGGAEGPRWQCAQEGREEPDGPWLPSRAPLNHKCNF